MNATKFGKILVYLQLIMSVCFAALAAGIYTNRIDWPGDPEKKNIYEQEIKGKLAEIQEEVAELQVQSGHVRWKQALEKLRTEEEKVPRYREWYSRQQTALEQTDVKELLYQDGNLRIGADGYPELAPLKEELKNRLKPLLPTIKKLDDVNLEISAEMKAMREKQLEMQGSNIEKTGRKVDGKLVQKGLRDLIEEQRKTQEHIQAELKYLEPKTNNRELDADLLHERFMELNARIEELKKIRPLRR